MLFIFRLLKALRLKRNLKNYIENRKIAIKEEKQKHKCCNRLRLWCRSKCSFIWGSDTREKTAFNACEKFRISVFTLGTYENYILKSIVGFLSGVLLTYLFFVFFILQLNFPLGSATTMCSIFGLVLSLGLAYSYRVRCITLMLLPQFFSKRGRQALVAYAFILALTGPAKNTLHNMRVLSETMACGQGKLKAAVKSLLDLIKKPFYAIKNSMKQVLEKIKDIVKKMKDIINNIKRIVQTIIGVIKDAYDWLNSVVSMCGKKAGTPFERCERCFKQAYNDCVEKVPSLFEALCKITDFVQGVCIIVKPIDYICELFDFVSDEIVTFVKKKLSEFSSQVKNIFYVSVRFSHNFEFHTEQSKTIKEIAAGIMLEVKQRSEKIVYFFDWMSFVFSFFFLYMLVQVLNYKRKYMANEWFDNHFITENIVHLDIQRTRKGLETILPLNVHEKKKYVRVSSIRLVANEKRALTKSAIFLGLSTVKLSIHMLTDYSLWWILEMIRYHGQFQTAMDNPSNIKVVVDGKGMLADLYSSILNTFQPTGIKFDLDTSPCLPDPTPPDLPRYKQIASLIVLAWILSILEPYGLRLRHSAMEYYYPARARVRAVWLYNHILRSRGSFLKYARRQLRRMFMKDSQGIEKVSLIDRLRAMFPFLQKICKGKEFAACLLCGGIGSSSLPLVKCPRPDCIGTYCVPCYGMLQNICTLCKLPIEYGDLSDISEERDSSDENASSTPSRNIEDGASAIVSDTTGALLQDTGESELSYDYQFKDRGINEGRSQIPASFKDVEAQKPRSRSTLDDYSFPVENHPEENEHKLTLAQRKMSNVWSFIHDPDSKPQPLHLSDNLFHEQQELIRNVSAKHLEERISDREIFKGHPNLMISKSDTESETSRKKHFRFPKIKDFYKKRKNGQTEVEMNDEEDSFKNPLLSSQEITRSGKKDSENLDSKIKLFGKEEPTTSSHKESLSFNNEVKNKSLLKETSRGSKSSQMVENWVKTGSYHSSKELGGTTAPETGTPSVHSSRIKEAATNITNLFKRFYSKGKYKEKKDKENAVYKYPASKKSDATNIQLIEKEKIEKSKFKKAKFWNIWQRPNTKYQTVNGSETSGEEGSTEEINSRDAVKTRTIHQLSLMRVEDTFIPLKRNQTPAKIVYERFKIDEYYA